MKPFIRICKATLAIVAAAVFVFALCSCAASDKAIKNANKYLRDKYGNMKFELVEYTQNRTTNGWYVAKVNCVDTKTDFTMYISNVRMTDSYGVTYVNSQMEKKIKMGPLAAHVDNIKSVQWLNEFEDGFENYTFRTVDPKENFEVADVKALYKVELKNCKYVSDVAELIYDTMTMFEAFGAVLGKTTFVFEIDTYIYTVIADYSITDEFTKVQFIKEMNEKDAVAKKENFLNIISLDFTKAEVPEEPATN